MGTKSFAHYMPETIVFSAFVHKQRITALARPAHYSPKEVAIVNSNKLRMTALNPSSFGMPTTGCAFGVITDARRASVQGTTVSAVQGAATAVRDRKAIAGMGIDGHTGLAKSYFPGTSAWRPPTC